MLKILYMKWSLFLSFAIDDLTAKYSLKAKIQKILIGLIYTFLFWTYLLPELCISLHQDISTAVKLG